MSSASRIPAVPEFGVYQPMEQLGRFRDWLGLVRSALVFVSDWNEEHRAAWFRIICGQTLRDIIVNYRLQPSNETQTFTSLIARIEEHFASMVDAAIEEQNFAACVQEENESVAHYFERLSHLTRHSNRPEETIRLHFITHMKDNYLMNLAITLGWSITKTVESASRHEALNKAAARALTSRAVAAEANRVDSQGELSSSVSAVSGPKRARRSRPFTPSRGLQQPRASTSDQHGSRPSSGNLNGPSPGNPCRKCGFTFHKSQTCPAEGRQCNNCSETGHFTSVCPKTKRKESEKSTNQVNKRRREDENQDWS